MEKTPISSSSTDKRDSTTTHILKSLNSNSYKISKPTTTTTRTIPNPIPNPNPSQSQPPVYNIDKSDFRQVVQKLTGSPAHLRPSPSEQQQQPPPPPTSADPPQPFARLHRIRPPPLSHLSARPAAATPALSPLPPLPTVSAAAESPITAYMRRLRGGPSPTATSAPPPPSSPLAFFGCVPSSSPRTAAASLLLPTSPRMPAPSPG